MKTFMTMVTMLAFVTPPLVPLAFARDKTLLPAFGKELVHDSQATGGGSKSDDGDDMRENTSEERPRPRGGGRSKAVRIRLDGDVRGGGTDDDDDGEF